MLGTATTTSGVTNVTFEEGDISSMSIRPASYDMVPGLSVFDHFVEPGFHTRPESGTLCANSLLTPSRRASVSRWNCDAASRRSNASRHRYGRKPRKRRCQYGP